MEAVSSGLEWVQNVVFLAVGVWAFVRWRRRGTEQSRWLAVTFLSLAVIIGVGLVTPEDGDTPAVVTTVLIALLVAFPYLLLRFLDSFERVPPRLRRVLGVATLVAVVWGAFLPDIEDEASAAVLAFTVLVVLVWVVTLGTVAAGTGHAGASAVGWRWRPPRSASHWC